MRLALRRMMFAIVSIALAVSRNIVTAQILHSSGVRPSFEVATIKPWRKPAAALPADGGSRPVKVMKVAPTGQPVQATPRVHMIVPGALLIASAYNLPVGSENRILNQPDWLRQDGEQYEIDAKIDDATFAAMGRMTPAQQHEQVELMEQSLLADRLKLKVHFEKAEMPVYALTVAKGGVKLAAAADAGSSRLSSVRDEHGMNITAISVTLAEFALSPFLTGALGRVVLNQTGLSGAYDFRLNWDPQLDAAPDSVSTAGPSLFTAVQEQLGLRLTASKGPVEVIVIDHIEPPSAN